jgi:hypothetical protein
MSLDLFRKVVDEAHAMGVQSVSLHFNGESTLHPGFAEMIRYASGRSFRLNYSTNGISASDEVIAATMAGVRSVNFSIHVDDERPLQTAKRFREARNWLKQKNPQLAASLNYEGQAPGTIEQIRRAWYDVVDAVGLVGTIEAMRWKIMPPTGRTTTKNPRCNQPLRYVAVLWDGTVTVCCRDLAGELAYGNVTASSLSDAISLPYFTSLRQEILRLGRPQKPLCARCYLWQETHRFPVLPRSEQTLPSVVVRGRLGRRGRKR